MLKKGDVVLAGVLLLAAAVSFGAFKIYNSSDTGNKRVAVIKQNNKIIKVINLDDLKESQEIKIDGEFYNIALAENGRIRFSEANCPDQICVNTGWLSNNGDIAVCLPNKVMIVIEGNNEEVDGVAF